MNAALAAAFVVGVNLLSRPLVNAINRQPMASAGAETCCAQPGGQRHRRALANPDDSHLVKTAFSTDLAGPLRLDSMGATYPNMSRPSRRSARAVFGVAQRKTPLRGARRFGLNGLVRFGDSRVAPPSFADHGKSRPVANLCAAQQLILRCELPFHHTKRRRRGRNVSSACAGL
jgi:hypothetical protein